MRAIRIIRETAVDSDGGVAMSHGLSMSHVVMGMSVLEREEQFRAVSDVVLESLRGATPERISNCLQKLNTLIYAAGFENKSLLQFDQSLQVARDPISAHGEFEISRILELLGD